MRSKKIDPVVVRNVKIGEGIPKICVSIVETTKENIIEEAEMLRNAAIDVIEWRADWFEQVFQSEKVEEVLKELREVLGDIPLLFTFRTLKEGGEKSIEKDVYLELNKKAAKSECVDLIDVEAFSGDDIVKDIIEAAHAYGVKVIVSNHDFGKTPDKEEIVGRLCKMQDLGADIPKIAVMPNDKKDVLELLAATEKMASESADRPIITMSMAGTGAISRLCGEVFGSALTFGSVKKASAPGQMDVEDLKQVLNLLHRSLQ